MNNSGGITLYVHIMINFYVSVIKKYPQKVLSILVAVAVAYVIILGGKASIMNSMQSNNVQTLKAQAYVCAPVSQTDSDKKIILRLDDVQAFAYTEITKKMIDDSVSHNMKLVLGVIPYNLSQDIFINKVLEKNDCNLELALHGWDHSISNKTGGFEFENMDEAEALVKIAEGKKILEQISGQPVTTFIPPGNLVSDSTKKALDQEGIKYLSGEGETNAYGMDATTYDFPSKKLVDNSEILKKCEKRFSQGKFCVIVIHPQDYLTNDRIDQGKYKSYINLLEELRNLQVYSTTFRDL